MEKVPMLLGLLILLDDGGGRVQMTDHRLPWEHCTMRLLDDDDDIGDEAACSLVLTTSAGVVTDAAMRPAAAPLTKACAACSSGDTT